MDHKRDVFTGMVLFCAVVEQDGFTAAARVLGHTPSHVSKEIARLETRLGTRLLNRTTRKISMTRPGQQYFEHARRIVSEARQIEAHVQAQGDRPFGELHMSVPQIFASACLNAWLPEFMALYPDVQLVIDVSDRKVDIVSEGIDMVVRIGELPPSEMIARELFRTGMPTVAAPAYLERHGTPQVPGDLAHHCLIDFALRQAGSRWVYRDPDGGRIIVPVSPRIRCGDAEMEKALAMAGCGITGLPQLVCSAELADGRLVRVLEAFEPVPAPVHVLFASRDNMPAKTRAMIDFLVRMTKQAK